jgi:hypothetical protein
VRRRSFGLTRAMRAIFPEGVIGNYKPRDRALSLNEYHALYLVLPPEHRECLQAFCGLGTRDSELYAYAVRSVHCLSRAGNQALALREASRARTHELACTEYDARTSASGKAAFRGSTGE